MFFLAAGSLELHLNEEAVGYYLKLSENGFERSSYVMGQLALAFYNIKGTCTYVYSVLLGGPHTCTMYFWGVHIRVQCTSRGSTYVYSVLLGGPHTCTMYFWGVHIRVQCTSGGSTYVYNVLLGGPHTCTMYFWGVHIRVQCTSWGSLTIVTYFDVVGS